MADQGKTLMMFGVLGAGGYLAYEYYKYSSALNTISTAGGVPLATLQQGLDFFTYLQEVWSGGTAGTATQQQIYAAIQQVNSGVAPVGATPGTTPSSGTQPTSVSTAPPTTPPPPPVQQQPPPPPPAPPAITRLPVTFRAGMSAMATNMQNQINMTMANADQWNYAYRAITGNDISADYGFGFDTVYGPVVNGARSSGSLTAQAFLNMAQASATKTPASAANAKQSTGIVLHSKGGTRGLGAIIQYRGPSVVTTGNMLYSAHHPYPYVSTYSLRGLTQPTGFERALLAGQPLRSNKVF